MRFVVVGDDFPAARMLELLTSARGIEAITAYTTFAGAGPGAVRLSTAKADIPLRPSQELRTPQGLAALTGQPFDWLINVNSTVLLPPELLALPRCGALNMHPGLLPEYAGLHTHQWAIRNGEREFGATVHFMEPQVDAGDIVAERRFGIAPAETGLSLFMKCMREGTSAMAEVLDLILSGQALPRIRQDSSRRRLYRRRDADDGRIDWEWPAEQIERFVRAGNYAPLESPSYTAHLDPVRRGGREEVIELLRVAVEDSRGPRQPGLVAFDDHTPGIVCGDGRVVRIAQVRWRGSGERLAPRDLLSVLAEGQVLQGRGRAAECP